MINDQEMDTMLDLSEDGLKALLPGWDVRLSHSADGGFSRWYTATSPSGESYEIHSDSRWDNATRTWYKLNVARLTPKPVVLPLSELVKQAEK